MKKTIALFSGGKDSFYSVQKTLKRGDLDLLISISSVSGDTQLHAGPEASRELRSEQLEGIGLPYREIGVDAEKTYLHQLFNGLQDIVRQKNVGYLVTGDLWHPYTGGIGDMLAGALGIELVRPAREECPSKDYSREYMEKVLCCGINGIVVSVREGNLPREFVGREINPTFLHELEDRNVDICGEGGEYQSLVVASPIMRGRIIIGEHDVESSFGKNGRERFYRMKIKKYRVEYEK